MDTTFVTPSRSAMLAAMDARRLDALEAGEPIPAEVAAFLATATSARTALRCVTIAAGAATAEQKTQ
jgi:hypothetical protein